MQIILHDPSPLLHDKLLERVSAADSNSLLFTRGRLASPSGTLKLPPRDASRWRLPRGADLTSSARAPGHSRDPPPLPATQAGASALLSWPGLPPPSLPQQRTPRLLSTATRYSSSWIRTCFWARRPRVSPRPHPGLWPVHQLPPPSLSAARPPVLERKRPEVGSFVLFNSCVSGICNAQAFNKYMLNDFFQSRM